jgi:hypothetical protein
MPELPHLLLRRVEYEGPRRKRPGFGRPPARDFQEHGGLLAQQIEGTLGEIHQHLPPAGINPSLILRIKLANNIDEESWRRAGLTLVGQTDGKTLVLFSSDLELHDFRNLLAAYQGGPAEGRKSAPYTVLFANIEQVGKVEPADRIGRLFRLENIESPENFSAEVTYTVDVELWHTGNTTNCRERLSEIRRFIIGQGGHVTDDYVGPSLVLARVKARGELIKALLNLEAVATIDRPPHVALKVSEQLNVSLQDLAATTAPGPNAPGLCIVDSGITSGHPLLGPALGEAAAVPAQLGDPSDLHGHGTMVAGLALYGDVQACIDRRAFVPVLRLYSARVLNANNEFDDESLITTQMRGAIEYFRRNYGCRVFNISLGDKRTPYNGGKVSPWASILDYLARELDVVIVVSAGNYDHEPVSPEDFDNHIHGYPRYLLAPPARIIEPATGCIVLTVGALANSASLPPGGGASVAYRPIAQINQPSPFTRSGPGIGGSIKPELCEYGGNYAADGNVRRLFHPAELSVVSFSKDYLQRLFRTHVGTSYAAPRVAHIASLLWSEFPAAHGNFIRALLAASAEIPDPSRLLLESIDNNALRNLCGYGVPSFATAAYSDSRRVLLHAESELPHDKFHIYEVPIPEEIYSVRGGKRITITLAFDPPVRHSRLDYLGTKMSFRLIRGRTFEEVENAFRQVMHVQQGAEEDESVTTTERIQAPYNCPMEPGPTARENSTLQKAAFLMKRATRNYGDTYFLVVRCQREWAGDEHSPQRYAIVVTLEHHGEVDLYARIQARLRAPVRLRTT